MYFPDQNRLLSKVDSILSTSKMIIDLNLQLVELRRQQRELIFLLEVNSFNQKFYAAFNQ